VAASTQNQALCALLFLYKEVLGREFAWLESMQRAKCPARLPVVLTVHQLNPLEGRSWLMAGLLYGAGLRLMECVHLRVKDVEFSHHEIIVREGKGGKDKVTMLPASLVAPLQTYLEKVRSLHNHDLAEGIGDVYLAFALAQKYPYAVRERGWQCVFPANKRSIDPYYGKERRHHIEEQTLQRAIKKQSRQQRFINLRAAIPYAIVSRLTCYRRVTTSVPYRNCFERLDLKTLGKSRFGYC
jgi:integrase